MIVQRYLIAMREDQFSNCDLHKDDCGDGVRFEDYAALEARCAGLERERDAWKQRVHERETAIKAHAVVLEETEQERDVLQAKLAAAEADREILVRERTKEPEMQAVFERAIAAFSRTEHISRCCGNEWRQRAEAAEEALRHTCKHLCQWKDACETGCPVSAILAGHAPATPQADHIADTSKKVQATLSEREKRLADSLEEILDYVGGAENALEDEYVMERARAALADTTTDEVQP